MMVDVTTEMMILFLSLIIGIFFIYYTRSMIVGIFPALGFVVYFSIEGYIYEWIWVFAMFVSSAIFVFLVIIPMFTSGGNNG